MTKIKRGMEIEKCIRIICESMLSHVAWTYPITNKKDKKYFELGGKSHAWEKKVALEYVEVIRVLINLL